MSKAVRILRICILPFPISVNAKKKTNIQLKIRTMAVNLKDFARNTYKKMPAIKHTSPDRVPEAKKLYVQNNPVIANRILSFLSLVVKATI